MPDRAGKMTEYELDLLDEIERLKKELSDGLRRDVIAANARLLEKNAALRAEIARIDEGCCCNCDGCWHGKHCGSASD